MYLDYFGFRKEPFSIAPDPRYLYLGPRHEEALAHLVYGLNHRSGGIVLLTGEVGTGKTTICRFALEQAPESCDIAFIYNPKLSIPELLATVCEELRIPCPAVAGGTKAYVEAINGHLLASHRQGRRTVLIIDEAQNLEPELLEQLRLLTNLETSECKLLQIILVGQPELLERLARPELRQLAQRIVARYHLAHLEQEELAAYVQHRLTVAGVGRRLFPLPVLRRIYRHSRGIPRLINVVCDRALLGAYAKGLDAVDGPILEQAAKEVLGSGGSRGFSFPDRRQWPMAAAGLALALAGAVIAAQAMSGGGGPAPAAAAPIHAPGGK